MLIATMPLISIVVLSLNRSALTIQALDSVLKHSRGFDIELIVVDNGSNAAEVAILVDLNPGARILLLDRNTFFGEGNNHGADVARGEFLLFLNNDTVVREGWLQPLIDAFDDPSTGLAGPVFVDKEGLILEAGAKISASGKSIQALRGRRFSDLPESGELEVEYVSAACVLIRRNVFDSILGFDYIYSPAYYEDVDLCLSVASLGLKNVVSTRSSVIHLENATSNKVLSRFDRLVLKRSNRIVLSAIRNAPRYSLSPPPSVKTFRAGSPKNGGSVTCLQISRDIHDEEIGFAAVLLANSLLKSRRHVAISVPGGWSSFKLRRMCQILGIHSLPVPVVSPRQVETHWNLVDIEQLLGVPTRASLRPKLRIDGPGEDSLPVATLSSEGRGRFRKGINRVLRELSEVGRARNILLSLSAHPTLRSLAGNLFRILSLRRVTRNLGAHRVKIAIRPQASTASRLNFLASSWLATRMGIETVINPAIATDLLNDEAVFLDGTQSAHWRVDDEATNPWSRRATEVSAQIFPIR